MLLVWLIAAPLTGGDSVFAQATVPVPLPQLDSALLHDAVAISSDPLGRLYVIDAENDQLLQLSSDGLLLRKIGGYGWSELSFDMPSDISTQNGLDVYVADYGNHRIQRYDQHLNYVST